MRELFHRCHGTMREKVMGDSGRFEWLRPKNEHGRATGVLPWAQNDGSACRVQRLRSSWLKTVKRGLTWSARTVVRLCLCELCTAPRASAVSGSHFPFSMRAPICWPQRAQGWEATARGQQIGARIEKGKWLPEQHWPSVQYKARTSKAARPSARSKSTLVSPS